MTSPQGAAPPPSPPGSLPGPHTTPKQPRRITPTYQPKGTLLTSSRWGHFYRVLTVRGLGVCFGVRVSLVAVLDRELHQLDRQAVITVDNDWL